MLIVGLLGGGLVLGRYYEYVKSNAETAIANFPLVIVIVGAAFLLAAPILFGNGRKG